MIMIRFDFIDKSKINKHSSKFWWARYLFWTFKGDITDKYDLENCFVFPYPGSRSNRLDASWLWGITAENP